MEKVVLITLFISAVVFAHARHAVSIGSNVTKSNVVLWLNGNGSQPSRTLSGSWLANSDIRIKTDFQTGYDEIEMIKKLRPVTFCYSEAWMKHRNRCLKGSAGTD